jgi:peptide/nickel transport system permease protein
VTRQRKLWCALILLACFHALVLFAGFFAPYDFAIQNRETAFAPPTRIHFVDAQGKVHARPFVYALKNDPTNAELFTVDSTQVYPIHFLSRGPAYKFAGLFSSRLHLFGVEEPGRLFLMGTDAFGRDQFSRFLYGGRISLMAGWIAAGVSLLIGMIVGTLAGFYGGWTDQILMRGGELFLALPWLYLLFAVRAALPLHVAEWQVFLLLVAVMGLVGWARPARLIRGVVLSAKERNFVLAARGFGASDAHVICRHLLPQTYGVVLTQMTLLVPQYVLAEVTLSFLGLGVSEPMPSWGTLLAALQQYYVLSSFWWMFLPALFLIPVFLLYYAAADALQERLSSVPL